MNVRSVKRGRPPTGDKRRDILDAALRIFADRGFHGTNVPDIAAAARVGTGSLYRYFASKEALVNEVYRDAKLRLRAALLDGLGEPAAGKHKPWFLALWRRLGDFAQREPDAFRFLEMQDHVAYLDGESREVELSVLAPLWLAGSKLRDKRAQPPTDAMIALLWGAFVGLVKASRLGYLRLDDHGLAAAGEACWHMISTKG